MGIGPRSGAILLSVEAVRRSRLVLDPALVSIWLEEVLLISGWTSHLLTTLGPLVDLGCGREAAYGGSASPRVRGSDVLLCGARGAWEGRKCGA